MVGNLKKLSLGIALSIFGTFVLTGCTGGDKSNSNLKQVGIIQHAEHPALDASREGFLKALEDKGFKDGEKVKVEFKNAQGVTANNDQIAKKFASDKKDLIFAIATPAAQASFNSTREIPIVITAVTDPVSAGLIKSMEKPETNVTGTSDLAPLENQFKLIKEIYPNTKKVGFIYNAGEPNSVVQAEEAKKVASSLSLELVEQTVTTTNDVAQATQSLVSKVDAIYVPTDNMVVSAGAAVADTCKKAKKPLFSAESSLVDNGALLSEGLDYFKLGYQTGLMAVEILEGKKPQDMKVELSKEFSLTINKKTLNELGVTLPSSINDRANYVGGE